MNEPLKRVSGLFNRGQPNSTEQEADKKLLLGGPDVWAHKPNRPGDVLKGMPKGYTSPEAPGPQARVTRPQPMREPVPPQAQPAQPEAEAAPFGMALNEPVVADCLWSVIVIDYYGIPKLYGAADEYVASQRKDLFYQQLLRDGQRMQVSAEQQIFVEICPTATLVQFLGQTLFSKFAVNPYYLGVNRGEACAASGKIWEAFTTYRSDVQAIENYLLTVKEEFGSPSAGRGDMVMHRKTGQILLITGLAAANPEYRNLGQLVTYPDLAVLAYKQKIAEMRLLASHIFGGSIRVPPDVSVKMMPQGIRFTVVAAQGYERFVTEYDLDLRS